MKVLTVPGRARHSKFGQDPAGTEQEIFDCTWESTKEDRQEPEEAERKISVFRFALFRNCRGHGFLSPLPLRLRLKRPFINSNSTVHKEKEMVDFRKALLLLAVLVFVSGIASAQALNCTLNGGAPPLLRAEGVAEEVGQAFITCQGGTPTASGQALPRINVRLFTNGYNITSKLIAVGSATASEATLLIDDPAPAAQVWASFPTPPQAPGCVAPYTGASCGNMFFAHQVSGNAQAIEWRDIPFDPPGTTTVRTLRFVNIRVNAALATGGNVTSLIPPPVNIFVSITGTLTLPITSPFLAVGYIQNGLRFSATAANFNQCASPLAWNTSSNPLPLPSTLPSGTASFTASFVELFPNAFRVRGGTGSTIPYGAPYQNDLTQIYNTESMFWGGVPGSGAYLNSGAGQATQATRLRLTFSGIPSGVNIAVPQTVTSGSGTTLTLLASPVDGSTASANGLVSLTGGAGAAVYEVTTANPGVTETLNVPVVIWYSGLPSLGSGTVSGSYAPLSTVDVASSTAPVPRFYQNPTATTAFTIVACETRLLFPFLTSIPGWDTGIAISNTTVDPFNTAAQTGTCTLFFYGTPGNTSQTSATIPAGGQLLMTLSGGNSAQNLNPVTGFTGYMIARCNFQYAHGYAFISDLGANKFAQGYLALILGSGLTTRYAGNASEALSQ
jgi:hypothetical protein